MSERDPRHDPQPGDVIRQSSGLILVVTARTDTRVHWVERMRSGDKHPNDWSLAAWRDRVAKNATVLSTATPGDSGHG